MKYQRLTAFCLAVLLTVAFIGCASTSKTVMSDQEIANNIKASLEAPTGPSGPFEIDINVHKGSVTLDGELPTQMSKEKAMQTAQSAQGVKDVKSFMVVK